MFTAIDHPLETACGAPSLSIVRPHLLRVLPNASAPLLVLGSLAMAGAINTEAALSFLGVGVQPPLASWGTMVYGGRRFVLNAPWMAACPGVAISIGVLAFNPF